MKSLVTIILAAFLAGCAQTTPAIRVFFTPPGQPVEDTVVSVIDHAQTEILVQGYGFNSEPIGDALKRARRNRDVAVKIILDRTNESAAASLLGTMEKSHRVLCYIDTESGIAHNKVMIIDSKVVLSGSYNWTNHAKKNEENLLIINDPAIAEQYKANWEERKRHTRRSE